MIFRWSKSAVRRETVDRVSLSLREISAREIVPSTRRRLSIRVWLIFFMKLGPTILVPRLSGSAQLIKCCGDITALEDKGTRHYDIFTQQNSELVCF
jgi:hypothetical protein